MLTVPVKDLLEAGVHFGTRASRWNPKMKPFIFARRNLIHIIDLKETLRGLIKATTFLQRLTAEGHQVLFVGTKRQAQTVIAECARRVNMPYVTETVARRHAHELRDGTHAALPAHRARGDREEPRHGRAEQEGHGGADAREAQDLPEPRRHPHDGEACRARSSSSTRRRSSNAVKEAAKLGIPGRRAAGHGLRSDRDRHPDPGQRRFDALGPARHQPPDRLDRRSGSRRTRSGRPRRRSAAPRMTSAGPRRTSASATST